MSRRPVTRRLRAALSWACAVATTLAGGGPAAADSFVLPARDTAQVLPAWKWRAGLFEPLEVGVGRGVSLATSLAPWFLLSPNVAVRAELGRAGPLTVTGEYGLSSPTGAMRILQGYLFPTFRRGEQQIGASLVPSAGLVVSGGDKGVWTARVDTAFGIPLGPTDARPLDSYAPIELIFAPALNGYRAHLGVMYDQPLLDWLRVRAGLSGYLVGKSPFPPRDPLYLSAEAALEVGLGSHVRLSLGGVYYNYDQRATELHKDATGRLVRVGVRSNDVYPTFDLIVGSR